MSTFQGLRLSPLILLFFTACGGGTTTPAAPVATSIVINGPGSVVNGLPADFTATVKDQYGEGMTGEIVTWASSNHAVATISASGHVTTLGVGTTSLSATDGSVHDSRTLTVTTAIATVTIAGPTRMKTGDSYQFTATARSSSGNILSVPFAWTAYQNSFINIYDGVILITNITPLQLTATAEGVTGTAQASGYQWTSGVFGATLGTQLVSDNLVLDRNGASSFVYFQASCTGGLMSVGVSTSPLVPADGEVVYSFGTGLPIASTWIKTTDFQNLSQPGNNAAKWAFLESMKQVNTFSITINEAQSVPRTALFRVSGLAAKLVAMQAACP